MIITRTPFRISFCGGGSDLPSFYQRHNGCVISTTINKYMYIVIHPTFNGDDTTVKYSITENTSDVRKIQHPIARQILLDYELKGLEIVSVADIPAGTGLGSSSSYTVGLLHAVNAYIGRYKPPEWLAEKACEIEIEKLGEPIGKQDQYAAACGGLNFIRFLSSGRVDVTPVVMEEKLYRILEENLLMFYTGDIRSASKILEEQSNNMKDEKKFNNIVEMTKLAYKMKESLENSDLEKFGSILHESWMLKKEVASDISNPLIEKYYDIAINNGAIGGKLLGAGGGGFLLFYCLKEDQKRLRAKLSDLVELPFKFDYFGSKVVHIG